MPTYPFPYSQQSGSPLTDIPPWLNKLPEPPPETRGPSKKDNILAALGQAMRGAVYAGSTPNIAGGGGTDMFRAAGSAMGGLQDEQARQQEMAWKQQQMEQQRQQAEAQMQAQQALEQHRREQAALARARIDKLKSDEEKKLDKEMEKQERELELLGRQFGKEDAYKMWLSKYYPKMFEEKYGTDKQGGKSKDFPELTAGMVDTAKVMGAVPALPPTSIGRGAGDIPSTLLPFDPEAMQNINREGMYFNPVFGKGFEFPIEPKPEPEKPIVKQDTKTGDWVAIEGDEVKVIKKGTPQAASVSKTPTQIAQAELENRANTIMDLAGGNVDRAIASLKNSPNQDVALLTYLGKLKRGLDLAFKTGGSGLSPQAAATMGISGAPAVSTGKRYEYDPATGTLKPVK